MTTPPLRMTLQQLLNEAQRTTGTPRHRVFLLALGVINYFLGRKWVDKHIAAKTAPTTHFRNAWSTQQDYDLYFLRVVDLGDLLFNLQTTDGFDDCIGRLKDAHQIQSAISELESARLLRIDGAVFRFVAPTGRLMQDYDLEVTLSGGRTVCVETKCKIDSTKSTLTTVQNTLNEARKQLPGDRPGAVFIRVPGQWISSAPDFGRSLLKQATDSFFRTTGRVVSVVPYATDTFRHVGESVTLALLVHEFINPSPRFGDGWRVMSDGLALSEQHK